MTPLEYLYSLELHGIKLGLDNITRLLAAAGDPHRAYPTLHVAGTNGKGSVVAMLDAMFRAAGYHTGRFISPHLVSVRERFLVDCEPIGDDSLDRHIERFREIADSNAISPTFFELCTAVAFREFADRGVDVGIIEVGLGGRFDSTNVVTPVVGVITNIALEHTQYLGGTLELIAFEKAGIIKPDTPLVCGETRDGPRDVIVNRANELGAPVRIAGRDFEFSAAGAGPNYALSYRGPALKLESVSLGLPGPYQVENAALAVAAAEWVGDSFAKLDRSAIETGLRNALWPCRLERVLDDPVTIIDVAHNTAGAEALARALTGRCVMVVAVSGDKDARRMLAVLSGKAERLILSQFDGARAMPIDDLNAAAPDRPRECVSSLEDAIARGLRCAAESGLPLIITGSLFTAGQARRILIEQYGAPPLKF